MRTRRIELVVAIAALLVLLWIGDSAGAYPSADEPTGRGETSVASVVSPLLQYQGRLTDPTTGEVVADGTYTMTFSLYDVASGGSSLWTETKGVEVQGGLFSTALGDTTSLDQGLFNGQALWLGIQVGADAEATPRQQVLPVAYALSLVPGAVISATSSTPALQVNNAGTGEALHVGGPTVLDGDLTVGGGLIGGSHTHGGADISSGTVAEARIDNVIARDVEVTSAVSIHAGDPDAHHSRYTNTEAWNAVLANDGPGSGLNADLLDGSHASAFAASSHGHDHGSLSGLGDDDHPQYFNLSQSETVNGRPYFYGGASGSTPPFYVDSNYRVANLNADLLDGYSSSSFASSSHNHWGESWSGSGTGLTLQSTSTSGWGVYGYASASSGTTYGVRGVSSSTSGRGVYGYASASSGTTNGVRGENFSTSGIGVYGGAFATSGTTYGVRGYSASSSGAAAGVYGISGGNRYGGSFDTGDYVSVRVENTSPSSWPALEIDNTDGAGHLITAWNGSDLEFFVHGDGNVTCDGAFTGGGADLAEIVAVIGERAAYEPGDVLVISPDQDRAVALSTRPYDTGVIGVYSTKPGFVGRPGPDYDEDSSLATNGLTGESNVRTSTAKGADQEADLKTTLDQNTIPVAIVGIVPVKVSAENGPIRPGDLLTTSSTPGHAMKAKPITIQGIAIYSTGTIIGKALGSLDSDTGVIQMLVMLQ